MPKTTERSAVPATPQADYNKGGARAQLLTVHNMVLQTLKQRPATRSSDRLLISEIYTNYFGVGNECFWQVMECMDNLPSFETIARCRRKIQEQDVSLRGVDAVEKERINRQIDFIEYSKEGIA